MLLKLSFWLLRIETTPVSLPYCSVYYCLFFSHHLVYYWVAPHHLVLLVASLGQWKHVALPYTTHLDLRYYSLYSLITSNPQRQQRILCLMHPPSSLLFFFISLWLANSTSNNYWDIFNNRQLNLYHSTTHTRGGNAPWDLHPNIQPGETFSYAITSYGIQPLYH